MYCPIRWYRAKGAGAEQGPSLLPRLALEGPALAISFSHRGTHAVVHFAGTLEWESAAELVDTVDTLTEHYFYNVVELVVTSSGGATEAFEHVLGAMRRWKLGGVHVVTRVVANASSAGALLVSLGAERVAAPRARFRFHNVMAPEPGSLTAAGARALERTLLETDARMLTRLAERTLATGADAPRRAGAENSDREVLEALMQGRRSRARTRSAGGDVRRLARALARRVERAVRRRDAAALGRLYARLVLLDCPISASLACTLGLIDRVDEAGYRPRGTDPASSASLTVPQWRALYPPNGEVPLAVLTRHVFACGETGSGKSASAILPVLAAAARASLDLVGCALVIDPKHELEPALAAIAPERLRPIVAAHTVLNVMSGQRWSIDEDVRAGRCLTAANAVLRRVVSFVPDIPARVVEHRMGRDPYWDLEGTELLLTVLAVVLLLLRPGASWLGSCASHPEARSWLRSFYGYAHGEGAERGPNALALAAWVLRGPAMRMCAPRSFGERSGVVIMAEGEEDSSGGLLFAHVAKALLDDLEALPGEARGVLERVDYWARLARVRNTFAGVLGSSVASTAAFAAPAVADTLYFGVEPGFLAAAHERESIDFSRAVSRDGEGCFYVFRPARDQRDALIAVSLKALYFESVLADPDRARGCTDMPIALYVADEFQLFVTSGSTHGEQSYFDTARSCRGACVVATPAVASLFHKMSEGAGGQRRDEAAVAVLLTNTATKMVFRTTDSASTLQLAAMAPERRGLTDVVRARPPSSLAVGEAYCVLPDGRFERRQLEPFVLEHEASRPRPVRAGKRRRRRKSAMTTPIRALLPAPESVQE